MATSKKMAVVMVFMAAVLLLATVESSAAAAAARTATATPSDSNQQLGLGATRKLLQIVEDTCGGNDCETPWPLGCCLGSPLCNGNICSTILQ